MYKRRVVTAMEMGREFSYRVGPDPLLHRDKSELVVASLEYKDVEKR
jgi:hypothetical protein